MIRYASFAASFLFLVGPVCAEPTFANSSTLRRGVNILGFDGIWEGGTNAPFRMEYFGRIREAGFDHVRINFFGFRFMDGSERLDPATLSRLDGVLDAAAASGLTVVLDQHDNRVCQLTPQLCTKKLVAFWSQIAKRYAGKRHQLIYEILNEPGGNMTAREWNAVLAETLAAIRDIDESRTVVVAALNSGNVKDIESLEIPSKYKNLIVTIHYYEPMRFTHQGASWSPDYSSLKNVSWGAPDSRRAVERDFSVVAKWAEDHNVPVYLGEFGVYDAAPPKSRAAWLRHVAQTAEAFAWGWSAWQFDHDFALFDSATHNWKQQFLDALMNRSAGD
jgi:endoglucanase